MKRVVLTLVFVLAANPMAFATWSVVAVNAATGEVVVASATCVAQSRFPGFPARDLMDIQAIVVPGKGAAAAQAGVDRTRTNQQLIFDEINKGTDPAAIIEMLEQDPNIDSRQFGIVDMNGRTAGHSGAGNSAASEPIFYAVQGNILANNRVVYEAVHALRTTEGSLTDRVMAAMEAADANGGDKRCTCESNPLPDAPCDSKTAHVAYILLVDATDPSGESFNDGDYALYIRVTDEDITADENANPVKTLRIRYDKWKAQEGLR